MATGTRKDPYANFNFVVEIDGVTAAGFQEVSGLTAEVNVIEYREGADAGSIRKLPGLRKFTNVTLKRGVTQDKSLWNWFKQTLSGAPARATVAITLLDEQRNAVSRWTLLNAWPAKWEGPPLNAKSNTLRSRPWRLLTKDWTGRINSSQSRRSGATYLASVNAFRIEEGAVLAVHAACALQPLHRPK